MKFYYKSENGDTGNFSIEETENFLEEDSLAKAIFMAWNLKADLYIDYYGTYELIFEYCENDKNNLKLFKEYEEVKKIIFQNFIKEKMKKVNLSIVKIDGLELEYVENQTYEICLEAVKENGYALEYVDDEFKTEELCLEAVKNNGRSLEYVNNQTPEVCMAAIKNDCSSLQFVKEQTYDLCLVAVNECGLVLAYVDDKFKTYELCLLAIKDNGYALKFVPDEFKTPELLSEAAKHF